MREIKFRAWDKEGKEMYSLGDLADCLLTTQFIENYGADLTRYEFMQFTGLHDKNGKEIYEGDVVRFKIGRSTYVGPVEYSNGQYQSVGASLGAINCEVIGNIYENPDVLK